MPSWRARSNRRVLRQLNDKMSVRCVFIEGAPVKRFKCLFALAALVALSASAQASIQLYAGGLTSADGGIVGGGQWITPGITTLDWTIFDNQDGTYRYRYVFAHPEGATSHLLIEISTNVTSLTDPDLKFTNLGNGTPKLGDFGDEGGSSPGIPGNLYSIKFDSTTGTTTTIEFDIARLPVWGDFYSKNGNAGGSANYAYNAGYLASDPTDAPANGALLGHLLVPDSFPPVFNTPVPEPFSIAIWSMLIGAASCVTSYRRRSS